jgi:hypothetical protein
MADNIMGSYGSSDITANIDVNLNNIDRSTQEAATLASQLKDWGTSIEAANKQIIDYTTSQSELLQMSESIADAHERIVNAARELKEISAASNVNLRDMATNAREIQNALSGLGGESIGGGGGGAPGYVPGTSSASPASILEEGGMGMPGAPEAPGDYGMGTDNTGGMISDMIAISTGRAKGPGGGRGRGPDITGKGGTSPISTQEALDPITKYGQDKAKQILNIPYWAPGGKIAALGRYVNNLGGGKLVGRMGNFIGRHPRIFGNPKIPSGAEAFQQSMIDSGIGPMTAEQAGMLPESVASSIMPEIGSAAASAEIAGGLDAAGVAASAGLLGAVGSAAAIVAPVAALGYMGYQVYSNYEKQGQLLGSLNGDNNPNKMLGYEASDFLNTLFNPRIGYGTAKEITMTGLAAGFQGTQGLFGGGSGLLGQYSGFASGAYQNYGIGPQDSLQMFNSAVIAAGSTVQQLSSALGSLANVSATTNTSFQQLQKNFTNSISYLGGLGATGSTAVNLAAGMSLANAGNTVADKYLQQQNIGGTGGLLQTDMGLALAAQTSGMSFTQAFGAMGTQQGANQLATATNTAVLNILKNNLGLYPGMPNLEGAITANLYQAYIILRTFLPVGPDGKPANWTPKSAHDWLMKELGGHGGGESIAAGQATGLVGGINKISGKTAQDTLHNALQLVKGTNGSKEFQAIRVGKEYYTQAAIDNMTNHQQQVLVSELLQGKATEGILNLSGRGKNGKFSKLGELLNSPGLSSFESNPSQALSSLQIELGTEASALFKLIRNPQSLTNRETKYLAQFGYNPTTGQTTGYVR